MKQRWKIPAILLGIVDVIAAAGILLLVLSPGESSAAGSGTETAQTEETNAETYFDAEYTASYTGLIQASTEEALPTPTPEPTPTATPEPTPTKKAESSASGSEMPDSDFIFPNSDTEKITTDQMKQLLTTKQDWQRAINEIYARHGYLFHEEKNARDYAYFNSKSWYQKLEKIDSQDKVRALFSDVEIANVDALLKYGSSQSW